MAIYFIGLDHLNGERNFSLCFSDAKCREQVNPGLLNILGYKWIECFTDDEEMREFGELWKFVWKFGDKQGLTLAQKVEGILRDTGRSEDIPMVLESLGIEESHQPYKIVSLK